MTKPPARTTSQNIHRASIQLSLFVSLLLCLLQDTAKLYRPQNDNLGASLFAQAQHQRFVDSSQVKPALILILPQSFKIPTNGLLGDDSSPQPKLQQYVAVINNAQDESENDKIRQHYKRLSLQVRDASSPITGQLFYEHVFEYFAPDAPSHLLIPVNLDQVSFSPSQPNKPTHHRHHHQHHHLSPKSHLKNKQVAYSKLNRAHNHALETDETFADQQVGQQQLIVSIRPHQLEAGFGSDSIELVSSAPVLVEPVASYDGRRSFAIVQTDKPIYKPSEKVRIRIMVVNENLRPVINDEMRLQVRNPHGMIVEEVRFPHALERAPRTSRETGSNRSSAEQSGDNKAPMFIDHTFEFPTEPMLGAWSVHLLHNDPVANDTTSFEVKEYVLPPFEITFDSPENILPSTRTISGAVVAKYHYGRPVQGKAQFKFGFRLSPTTKTKFVARSNIKSINLATGRVEYNISLDKFRETEWFPAINGARLVVEATVTEMTTGHRETAQDTASLFVQMPYKISFEESIEDFKPGLVQPLTVNLLEVASLKAGPAGQKIVAFYQDQNGTYLGEYGSAASEKSSNKLDLEALTDAHGKAVFNIGPISDEVTSITATMKLLADKNATSLPREVLRAHRYTTHELALDHHTLTRHDSQNGWIALMNKTVTRVNVGERFVSDLLIRDAMVVPKKIFYIVLVRGQIVRLATISEEGLVDFEVGEEMMPSMRLVLFALTHDSIGLLSDSMRIEVGHELACGLKLRYSSEESPRLVGGAEPVARPNERGRLEVSARGGDLVSLIGVDNAVHSLNNRTRLDSVRVIERIRRLDAGCGFGGGKNNLDVFHNAGLMFHKDLASGANEADASHIGSACLTVANQMKFTEEAAMGYSKPVLSLLSRALGVAQRLRWSSSAGRQRSKREIDPEVVMRRFKSPMQRACCRLGTLEDIPQKRNCTVRKRIVEKYMQNASGCSVIYYECCRAVFGEPDVKLSMPFAALEPRVESRVFSSMQQTPVYRSEQVINFGQLDKIEAATLVRRDFRETWLFDLVQVDETSGRGWLDVEMPHSISSWSVSAVALNRFKSMCIMARPFKMSTFQEVFVQLSLPYKVVQGEQIDMVATLYNYSPKNQDVLVYMYGVEDVCSEAEPEERSEGRRVQVDRQSSQAVIFSIIPLKTGRYPIKVVAVTLNSNNSDIIEQQLNVVPRGKPVTDEITFSLDPLNQQRRSKRAIQTGNLLDDIDSTRGLQHSQVRLAPSRESDNIVPQTQECVVSAIGDKMGQAVQTSILDVENLIRLPHGCGEQVMIYLGPTLYTARYLHSINKLSGDLRWRAVRYIQSGYKSVLNFRKEEGAFSSFAKRDASVWLTAYVTKLLCQTERTPFIAEELYVDKTVINSALSWLVDSQNKETGTWTERNPVYHREMLGGVLRENALTAFVTITLNECIHHSQDIVEETSRGVEIAALTNVPPGEQTNGVDKLRVAVQQAEESLIMDRHRALREKNPYVLALVAYALSYARPRDAASILADLMSLSDRIQTKNQVLWRGDYPIETAAYALQTLVELAPFVAAQQGGGAASSGADALAIANWLSSRRSYTGAFESTQDTVVALEALAKFSRLQATPSGSSLIPQRTDTSPNLFCNVTFSNRTKRSIEFDKDNAQILQTFKLQSFDLDPINGETLDIMTSGNGLGTMSVKLKYNVYQDEDEICRFDIDSSIEEWLPPKVTMGPEQKGAGEPDQKAGEPTGEDDFFKTFDKSMLNELNLLGQNEQTAPPKKQAQNPSGEFVLRTKRLAPIVDLSRPNVTSESWTSKVVSSFRSRLPAWIVPKSASTPTSSTTPLPPLADQQMDPTRMPDNPRRNATARRSAQTAAPIISTPSGIPSDAHLNILSGDFEINGNQSKSANSTHSPPASTADIPARRLVLLLRVCAHHMSSRRDSEMAVIEVGVLSGFKPNEADLKEILNDVGTPAMKYELSADRSLVILYLKYIPFSGPYCFQFRLVRDSLVYNLQSGYIRVYEYYSPTHSCSNFYTPSRVNNLIETKCDASGQVCQCASKSLCPATKKLIEIGDTATLNATSAREQLTDLVCSNKYDLVSLVRLKSVRYMEASQMFKLSLRVKSDLRGNLTKLIEQQRQQKAQLIGSVRRPAPPGSGDLQAAPDADASAAELDENSLDYLSVSIDSSCVRGDPMLLHLAHPNQWRLGGELMILFSRSARVERLFFKSTPKTVAGHQSLNDKRYSQLALALDKETILHDVTYQAKLKARESINNLILWLDLKARRESWNCPSKSQ